MSSTVDLPEPSEVEKKTLERFEAPDNVRLACQLMLPSGEVELERILPPDVGLDALVPPSRKLPQNNEQAEDLSAETAT